MSFLDPMDYSPPASSVRGALQEDPVAGPVSAREPVCPGDGGKGPPRGRDDRKWGTRVGRDPRKRGPLGKG